MITAIRKQRLTMGLTQKQLAKKFNVSPEFICELEWRYYKPISEKWRRTLAEFFDAPQDDLFSPDGRNRLVYDEGEEQLYKQRDAANGKP